MNLKVFPMPGWVALRVLPQEEKHGSLVLPEKTAEERMVKQQLEPTLCEIVAVGDTRLTEFGTKMPPTCRVGEIVVSNGIMSRAVMVGESTKDLVFFCRETDLYTKVSIAAVKES